MLRSNIYDVELNQTKVPCGVWAKAVKWTDRDIYAAAAATVPTVVSHGP